LIWQANRLPVRKGKALMMKFTDPGKNGCGTGGWAFRAGRSGDGTVQKINQNSRSPGGVAVGRRSESGVAIVRTPGHRRAWLAERVGRPGCSKLQRSLASMGARGGAQGRWCRLAQAGESVAHLARFWSSHGLGRRAVAGKKVRRGRSCCAAAAPPGSNGRSRVVRLPFARGAAERGAAERSATGANPSGTRVDSGNGISRNHPGWAADG